MSVLWKLVSVQNYPQGWVDWAWPIVKAFESGRPCLWAKNGEVVDFETSLFVVKSDQLILLLIMGNCHLVAEMLT